MANNVVLAENLGDEFTLDTDTDTIHIDAAEVNVATATNISATTLLDALSEIGGRLDALEP